MRPCSKAASVFPSCEGISNPSSWNITALNSPNQCQNVPITQQAEQRVKQAVGTGAGRAQRGKSHMHTHRAFLVTWKGFSHPREHGKQVHLCCWHHHPPSASSPPPRGPSVFVTRPQSRFSPGEVWLQLWWQQGSVLTPAGSIHSRLGSLATTAVEKSCQTLLRKARV